MIKRHLIAIAAVTLLSSNLASAQASAPAAPGARPAVVAPGMTPSAPMARQARMDRDKAYKGEKDKLEEKLKAATKGSDYAKILEKAGYKISSINADKKDYLEYEVVKGDHSYEVQLDFDNGAQKATKIDVTMNMWRADCDQGDAEGCGLQDHRPLVGRHGQHVQRPPLHEGLERREGPAGEGAAPNMKVADYRPKLEKMGYKITSVNDREADYVEYEIVKGENSYEVQIDVDPATKVAKKVDVTTNLWDAEGTDRAKEKNEAMKVKK